MTPDIRGQFRLPHIPPANLTAQFAIVNIRSGSLENGRLQVKAHLDQPAANARSHLADSHLADLNGAPYIVFGRSTTSGRAASGQRRSNSAMASSWSTFALSTRALTRPFASISSTTSPGRWSGPAAL